MSRGDLTRRYKCGQNVQHILTVKASVGLFCWKITDLNNEILQMDGWMDGWADYGDFRKQGPEPELFQNVP